MAEPSRNAGDPFSYPPEYSLTPDPVIVDDNPAGKDGKSEAWTVLRELIETVVLALIIFLLIRQGIQNYRIESFSMRPNFDEGQFVLVNKLAYRIGEADRGDVVVFHNPNNTQEDYIKRVVGLPGDMVEIRERSVYINGERLDEPYTNSGTSPQSVSPNIVVSPNHLFVMGDNRDNSRDSRSFGELEEDLVVGKAWIRVWPPEQFGPIFHYEVEPGKLTATE